ncbi:MAG: hypothetical protein JWM35_1767 [Verrucomicrobia bacterium]|nr:hypothetical protein [Verrucomicrobiota bacterium]
MLTDAFAHFVFVDFENVSDIDLGLVEGKAVHVTLLIGKNQKKLDLTLVRQIHRLAVQVELVEVGASGHNALDLTLACYLGQAVQQWPTAEFHIVSKDQDFEPMVGHLAARGTKVARCDAFHLLHFLPRPKPSAPAKSVASAKAASTKSADDKRTKVLARLKNPSNSNRPTTEKALRAHIKTGLGKESSPAKVEEVLAKLRGDHDLTIEPGGRIFWP